ncbi:hypothetical protein [Streptomyces sp. DHE17-7]|uniref:hypothetical protein n=1 Tax=Streptomyces sp. DHE17-7 TaxID=2759949 RepID=UPI0022EB62A6|nr:hypothetical protein [Streptomyces sp. DHE17-7]MBJ6618738.1 hypothetical protein [Streptomyces sp. DHE17-7]
MTGTTLHRVLEERLRAKNRPLPQRSQENGVGRLPLARNKARAGRRRGPAGPVLAADVRAALVATGLSLARLLRAEGNTRDALPVLRLALQEQRTGDGRGDLVEVQLELSELLAETGQVREAIEVLELAFQQAAPRLYDRAGWSPPPGDLQESGKKKKKTPPPGLRGTQARPRHQRARRTALTQRSGPAVTRTAGPFRTV